MWHQPCQRCMYITSVDSKKTRYKMLFTHAESHASAVSLLENRSTTTSPSGNDQARSWNFMVTGRFLRKKTFPSGSREGGSGSG